MIIKVVLNDAKFDDWLSEFVDNFRIVTNFPNEKQLGVLIEGELGKELNLLNANLVCASFEKEILDFLGFYRNRKAEFYTDQCAENLFDNLNIRINELMMVGLSRSYPEKLENYGIQLKANLLELYDFLMNHNQLFHYVTGCTRLGAIKVLQTLKLEQTGKYKARDSVIFIRFRTLLRTATQTHVLNAFKNKKTHNLIVIEVQDKVHENQTQLSDELSMLIKNLLAKQTSKKIILIDSKKRSFSFKCQMKADEIIFEDLELKSQEKVLEKKVNFQGRSVQLNELIDIKLAPRVLNVIHMANLLDEVEVVIGDEQPFSSIGYVKEYYIERQFRRHRLYSSVLNEKCELFYITGASKDDIIGLGIEAERIQIFEYGDMYENGIVVPPVGLSDQENEQIFRDFQENVHWLHYRTHLFWAGSKRSPNTLINYIDRDYVASEKMASDGIVVFDENYFTLSQKIVIVANDAGMGKSTVLTSIARQMKGFNSYNVPNNLWIIRINLNDYADLAKPNNLHKIDFHESDIENAIEFVSEMAILDNNSKQFMEFQKKLFKISLSELETGHMNIQRPKIVMQLDGFDEICPGLKFQTTTLIKALAASQVAQIWITTRFHEELHLEHELNAVAFVLRSFTIENQIEFSNKLWKWFLQFRKNPYSGETYERNHKDILKTLNDINSELISNEDSASQLKENILKIVNDFADEHVHSARSTHEFDKFRDAIDELDFSVHIQEYLHYWNDSISVQGIQFTDNPLQLKMLTEVMFAMDFKLPKHFGLLDLYDQFIETKFVLYYREKEKRIEGNQGSNESRENDLEVVWKVHCALAVKSFFHQQYVQRTLPHFDALDRFDSKEHGKKEKEKYARRGILSLIDDRLEFIHRSFSEYFLSKYLINNLENHAVQELLVVRLVVHTFY